MEPLDQDSKMVINVIKFVVAAIAIVFTIGLIADAYRQKMDTDYKIAVMKYQHDQKESNDNASE